MKTKLLTLLLVFISVIDQYLIIQGSQEFRFFSKILLVPILLAIYILDSREQFYKIDLLFVSGLVLSFFGDLFLLFSWGFLAGLGSFLLGHIFYIFSFKNLKTSFSIQKYIPFVLIYLFSLLYLLFPYLKEMKIPVILYAIIISTMLLMAVKTKNRMLIFGAFFFVISDSILSFRLFIVKGLVYDVLVMLTYVLAQYLLVKGMLRIHKKKEPYLGKTPL